MNDRRKRITTAVAGVVGALLALLAMSPLFIRDMSPITAGVILGALGVLCLLGIGLGVWNVRKSEAKRKAKEQIWLKH